MRPHILMTTNHGIHDFDVLPGLPDTGGQNVFVNQMSRALVELGFAVTVLNRGGYVHPRTGALRRGERRRGEHERIIWIEDGAGDFVAKEDMAPRIPALVEDALRRLRPLPPPVCIVSHYWDGAALADGLVRGGLPGRHLFVPHSLGCIKKRNMPPERWAALRIDGRMETERRLVARADGVAATSALVRDALAEELGVPHPLFLPPCVDPERFRPRAVSDDDPLWDLLSHAAGRPAAEIRRRPLVCEVSRSDRTKRKDLLLRAFAAARREVHDAFLVLTVDAETRPLGPELVATAEDLGLTGSVALLGSVAAHVPSLMAAATVYCTPSEMEGFGMSLQEAAASGTASLSSDLVPFATECLCREAVALPDGGGLRRGEAGLLAEAGDEAAFARGLVWLLRHDAERATMGRRARELTVPAFTWGPCLRRFLAEGAVPLPPDSGER